LCYYILLVVVVVVEVELEVEVVAEEVGEVAEQYIHRL
jgi:hypothetical protein